MCVFSHSDMHVWGCPWRSEEGFRFIGTGVTGRCEPTEINTKKKISGHCKSSKCFFFFTTEQSLQLLTIIFIKILRSR